MTDAAQVGDVTLLELLDRVIDHGVVLAGDITISVADVDLIYLGLRVLLTSVERAEGLPSGLRLDENGRGL
jgi:gas vesicle structural protein